MVKALGIEGFGFLYLCYNIHRLIKGGVNMEKIVMPELITPAIADIMASRPEVLDQLLGCMGDNEETESSRSLVLDEDNLPKVLKLLFCNVKIRINNACTEAAEAPYSSIKKTVESMRKQEERLEEKRLLIEALQDEVDSIKENVLVTETMLREYLKILKLICKIPGCRKLTYKYKLDIKGMQNGIKNPKRLLEEKMQLLECAQYEKNQIEAEIRRSIWALLEQLE